MPQVEVKFVFTQGQIVFSKHGRDMGRPFIIFSIVDEYVYLVDGTLRKLEKPKKKKNKHVQVTSYVDADMKHKLENNLYLLDADIRKALKVFMDNK